MSEKMGSFRSKSKQIIILLLFITAAVLLGTFMVSSNDTYYSNFYPAKNTAIIFVDNV